MKRSFLIYKREYWDYLYNRDGNTIYHIYTRRFYITSKLYIDLGSEYKDTKD